MRLCSPQTIFKWCRVRSAANNNLYWKTGVFKRPTRLALWTRLLLLRDTWGMLRLTLTRRSTSRLNRRCTCMSMTITEALIRRHNQLLKSIMFRWWAGTTPVNSNTLRQLKVSGYLVRLRGFLKACHVSNEAFNLLEINLDEFIGFSYTLQLQTRDGWTGSAELFTWLADFQHWVRYFQNTHEQNRTVRNKRLLNRGFLHRYLLFVKSYLRLELSFRWESWQSWGALLVFGKDNKLLRGHGDRNFCCLFFNGKLLKVQL